MQHLEYYATSNCFLRRKVEAAASIAKYPITRNEVENADVSNIVFPRYPSLKTEGGIVSGSNASCRYIANAAPTTELYGRSLMDRANVDAMLDCIATDLESPIFAFVKKAPKETVAADLKKGFARLDSVLAKQTFLVCERLTIADLAAAGVVGGVLDKEIMTKKEIGEFVNLTRLFNTISGRCNWGLHVQAEKKADSPSAVRKKSDAKKSDTSAKKVDAPAKKAEPAPAPAKPKDPIELLPPTDFDMEAWKRYYSNSKDLKGDAMPWLWEKLDREGFTFWHMKYIRFSDSDNVKVFMASNLLGMYLQRIDNWLRKYMFAVCNVFEETGYFDVEGVFLIRGKELPVRLVEHDQFESFTWTKLDIDAQKKLIEDYFCEGDEINGRKIADCKVYK